MKSIFSKIAENSDIFKDFDLPANFLSKTEEFYNFLLKENLKSNLTSITSAEDFFIKHILDSLLALNIIKSYIKKNDFNIEKYQILDLGCGGGFPSIVLAMTKLHAEIYPLESKEKKINFVANCADFLGLKNVKPICGRGRETACKSEFAERFNLITARAVGDTEYMVKETRKMLKKDVIFLFYKTPDQVKNEMKISTGRKPASDYIWTDSEIYKLPFDKGVRQFLIGKAK